MQNQTETVHIIVPYRDREAHLLQFVPHMERFLGNVTPQVTVVAQADDKPFNKGALVNVGATLLRGSAGYVVCHDVDMLPLDSACDYSLPESVTHLAGAAEQFDYRMPYLNYLGGVLAITLKAFERVNGYSNRYWGWGAEDDDMFLRLWCYGITPKRSPGRFRSLLHPRSSAVIENMALFSQILESVAARTDGLPADNTRQFRQSSMHCYRPHPEVETIFRNDGMSTVSYRLKGEQQLHRAFDFATPIQPHHRIVSVELEMKGI